MLWQHCFCLRATATKKKLKQVRKNNSLLQKLLPIQAFDASFENVLNRYYALRDAAQFASDTAAANQETASLIQSVQGLKLDELKAIDTAISSSPLRKPIPVVLAVKAKAYWVRPISKINAKLSR